MAIHLGTRKVKDIYLGNQKVKEIYLGNSLAYRSTGWKQIFSGSHWLMPEVGDSDFINKATYRFAIPGYSGSLTGKHVQIKAYAIGGWLWDNPASFGSLGIVKNESNPSSNVPWSVPDGTGVFVGDFTLFKPVSNYIEGEWAFYAVHGGYFQCFNLSEVWVYE